MAWHRAATLPSTLLFWQRRWPGTHRMCRFLASPDDHLDISASLPSALGVAEARAQSEKRVQLRNLTGELTYCNTRRYWQLLSSLRAEMGDLIDAPETDVQRAWDAAAVRGVELLQAGTLGGLEACAELLRAFADARHNSSTLLLAVEAHL
eukprot:1137930-Amphidinium_carterae.1